MLLHYLYQSCTLDFVQLQPEDYVSAAAALLTAAIATAAAAV